MYVFFEDYKKKIRDGKSSITLRTLFFFEKKIKQKIFFWVQKETAKMRFWFLRAVHIEEKKSVEWSLHAYENGSEYIHILCSTVCLDDVTFEMYLPPKCQDDALKWKCSSFLNEKFITKNQSSWKIFSRKMKYWEFAIVIKNLKALNFLIKLEEQMTRSNFPHKSAAWENKEKEWKIINIQFFIKQSIADGSLEICWNECSNIAPASAFSLYFFIWDDGGNDLCDKTTMRNVASFLPARRVHINWTKIENCNKSSPHYSPSFVMIEIQMKE